MQRVLVILLALLVLVAVFVLQNSMEVVIRLWFWSVETSLALVLIITFAAGALVGILFSIPGRKRKKKTSPADVISDETGASPGDKVPLEVSTSADEADQDDPEFEDV